MRLIQNDPALVDWPIPAFGDPQRFSALHIDEAAMSRTCLGRKRPLPTLPR